MEKHMERFFLDPDRLCEDTFKFDGFIIKT